MLEHHAHLLAVEVDIQLLAVFVLFLGNIHALKDDRAGGRLLQQVQGAEKGGLAGTGGSDDHHHIPPVDVHGHTVQGLDGALVVMFFQVLDLDQLIVCLHGSSSFQNVRSLYWWGRSGRSTAP